MKFTWIFFVIALGLVALFGVFNLPPSERSNSETASQKLTARQVLPIQRKLASNTGSSQTATASASESSAEPINPLTKSFAIESRKKNEIESETFKSIENERREPIALQVVGNISWSVFSDLQVTKDPVANSLFSVGPYHVSRKNDQLGSKMMSLVYDENQQTLGVLTGRLVVKVRDLYDVDLIAREYELKIDNLSTEIRTAYLDASRAEQLMNINSNMKKDSRIERFYFEIVKTSWVKN